GKGIGSRVQDFWHDGLGRYQSLRYQQVERSSSETNFEGQIGLQKILSANVGNFTCSLSAQGLVGLDSRGRGVHSAQLQAEAGLPYVGVILSQEVIKRAGDLTR
ncbi:MAG: hypothetical protein ACK5RO_03685, partial [Pseudobdellovibrionaceae bacterium]